MKGNPFRVAYPILLWAGVIAGTLFAAGCGNSTSRWDQKEDDSPWIRKAQDKKRYGDEDAAIELYQQALVHEPTLARAHLELAFLLDKASRDYVVAIYHYRRYLELRPGTDKKEMIEDRIRMTKLALASALIPQSTSGAARMMALEKENANLRIDNDYLRNELRDVRDRLDAMGNVRIPAGKIPSNEAAVVAPAPIAAPIEAPAPETPAKLRSVSASATQTTAVLRLNAPPTSAPLAIAPPPATAATARATATVSVRESARRTRIYQVQTGDTLMKISVKMYGTSRRWRDIYNSNHTAMRNDRDLRVGQTLSIPP